MSAPEPEKKQSGLSLQTLIISSLAAATAAIVVPTFWQRGSVIATAFTPIVVALVSEALRRPADKITAVTPRVARRSATGAAVREEQPTGTGARGQGPEQVSRWGTEDDPFGLREPAKPRRRFPLAHHRHHGPGRRGDRRDRGDRVRAGDLRQPDRQLQP